MLLWAAHIEFEIHRQFACNNDRRYAVSSGDHALDRRRLGTDLAGLLPLQSVIITARLTHSGAGRHQSSFSAKENFDDDTFESDDGVGVPAVILTNILPIVACVSNGGIRTCNNSNPTAPLFTCLTIGGITTCN
jgi:hypothetical protein